MNRITNINSLHSINSMVFIIAIQCFHRGTNWDFKCNSV